VTWTPKEIFAHVLLSLREPRRAAAEILSWNVPDIAIAPLAVLAVIILTLATELVSAIAPPPTGVDALYVAPLALAVIDLLAIFVLALGTSVIGRAFGGVGQFKPALLLTAWLHFLGLIYIVPITLVAPFSAFLAEMLELAALFYVFWVTLSFVAVLHGFKGLGMPFLVVFLASVVALAVFWGGISLVAVEVPGTLPATTGGSHG